MVKALGCALGGAMVGFFANKLDQVWGALLFTIGVFILIGSAAAIAKSESRKQTDETKTAETSGKYIDKSAGI